MFLRMGYLIFLVICLAFVVQLALIWQCTAQNTNIIVSDGCEVAADVVGIVDAPTIVTSSATPGDDDRWAADYDVYGHPILGPHWIIIELPIGASISSIDINWETAYSNDWVIYGNTRNSNCSSYSDPNLAATLYPTTPWNICMNISGGWVTLLDTSVDTITTAVNGRHIIQEALIDEEVGRGDYRLIKLYMRTKATYWGVSIYRIHVWGKFAEVNSTPSPSSRPTSIVPVPSPTPTDHISSPTPQPISSISEIRYRIGQAAADNAGVRSVYKSAQFVVKAIETAGVYFPEYSHIVPGKFGPLLESAGFLLLSPKEIRAHGDVAVWSSTRIHSHGHVQIYFEGKWYSDYAQQFLSPWYVNFGSALSLYRYYG
jgi:hypothetical protein